MAICSDCRLKWFKSVIFLLICVSYLFFFHSHMESNLFNSDLGHLHMWFWIRHESDCLQCDLSLLYRNSYDFYATLVRDSSQFCAHSVNTNMEHGCNGGSLHTPLFRGSSHCSTIIKNVSLFLLILVIICSQICWLPLQLNLQMKLYILTSVASMLTSASMRAVCDIFVIGLLCVRGQFTTVTRSQ